MTTIIIATVISFIAGYLTNRIASKKSIADKIASIPEGVENPAWKMGFDDGWNSATNDAIAVKNAYQKLFMNQ